jgi:hypothetical protein
MFLVEIHGGYSIVCGVLMKTAIRRNVTTLVGCISFCVMGNSVWWEGEPRPFYMRIAK